MHPINSRRARGFTLIELAVVLLIVIVLLTLGAGVVNLASENSALSQTRRKQEAAKDALIAYLGKNKRLPCPDLPGSPGNIAGTGDDNRAIPNDPTSACTADVGVLPYIELGIPREFALDGWENFYTYRVTIDAGDVTLDWTRSASFAPGKPGKLDVSARVPATNPIPTPLTPAPEHAVAVLISHGKNGLGAWTALGTRNLLPDVGTDERANADATGIFVQRDIADVNAGYGAFDDIVTFVRATDLIAPLVKDGTVRSAEGETNYQIGVASDEATARYISSSDSTLPPSLTSRKDGWGKGLAYFACAATITSTTPADNQPAYRIVSGGPNLVIAAGTSCTSVDPSYVVFDMPAGTLRTLYLKAGKTPP
jgi:type II secretory pathway pseudopilin PulG